MVIHSSVVGDLMALLPDADVNLDAVQPMTVPVAVPMPPNIKAVQLASPTVAESTADSSKHTEDAGKNDPK